MRYFGMTDMTEIQRMTLKEYSLRMKARNLKNTDEEFQMHLSAWVNREVNAQRKSGKHMKYVYKNFKDFYDYDKAISKVTGEESDKPKTIAERLKDYERSKKNGGEL